ncbi:MAG: hypothetical protein H6736_17835 [Alphaproteobacteria bacterium]|nr:hypothetical protein [Alphaproteobacteria bacterium]
MRRLWDEWGIPIVLAAPIVAWYIWLDQNPSMWGALLFNVLLGGAAGAVSLGGVGVMAQLGEEEPTFWRWVVGGFVAGAWCNTTLAYLFEVEWGEGPLIYDLYARGTWSLAGLLAVGAVWSHRSGVRRLAIAAMLPGLLAALWGRGDVRTLGAAGLLLWFVVLAAVGWWVKRGEPEAEEA